MPGISPLELLEQLRGMAELVAKPPEEQRTWLLEHRCPSDELMLQLIDAVPAWVPRLREASLIDDDGEQALSSLTSHLQQIPDTVYQQDLDGLDNPAWEPVRREAARIVELLRRHGR